MIVGFSKVFLRFFLGFLRVEFEDCIELLDVLMNLFGAYCIFLINLWSF